MTRWLWRCVLFVVDLVRSANLGLPKHGTKLRRDAEVIWSPEGSLGMRRCQQFCSRKAPRAHATTNQKGLRLDQGESTQSLANFARPCGVYYNFLRPCLSRLKDQNTQASSQLWNPHLIALSDDFFVSQWFVPRIFLQNCLQLLWLIFSRRTQQSVYLQYHD